MPSTTSFEKMGYAQKQRLTFIELIAYWEGRIDRSRVVSEFGVSPNHVTKDFRHYKKAFPQNLQYDVSARTYRPAPDFKPQIGTGVPEEYLGLLKAKAGQRDGNLISSLLSGVESDTVPFPNGKIDGDVLKALTRAISSGTGLQITYQSQNRALPIPRKIWPHALVFNGLRWHARAYDLEHGKFIDLVLQRILDAAAVNEPIPVEVEEDAGWTTLVTIDVIPRRSLSAEQAETIAREYGMTKRGEDWVWSVRLRECLAGYFIYLHRLDIMQDNRRAIELLDISLAEKYIIV